MKKFGFGRRLMAILLVLTMLVSLLPTIAVQAAVGDIVEGDTELVTNIDTLDTIRWPIKIYDFLDDGMLFEYSMQNFYDDTTLYEEYGLAYGGGYSMPMSAEYHIGEDFTCRAGYYKLKTSTTSYAFANWGNLSATMYSYDDNATEVSRKAVAAVNDESPMYLHHEYVGDGNSQSYGWISNFARDSKQYYSKDDVRYMVMVYRTNELYATNTNGEGREMEAYWAVSRNTYSYDYSYFSGSIDISDVSYKETDGSWGWKANGFYDTGLLAAERVTVAPSEEWTYIIVDMKTDLQAEAYKGTPMSDDYNYGIASNWDSMGSPRVAGVGIGLPLGSKGEEMDITHVAYFSSMTEAEYFGNRAIRFNNDPGVYVGRTVTTSQTNSSEGITSYTRNPSNNYGKNLGTAGLTHGLDTHYACMWEDAYRESYAFYSGYYSGVSMSAADGYDYSDTMMHYRRLTATSGVARKTYAISESYTYWLTTHEDAAAANTSYVLTKYATLVYRTNNVSDLKIGYWLKDIYSGNGKQVGENDSVYYEAPESQNGEYVYAVLDLTQLEKDLGTSITYYDSLGLKFDGMDDGDSIDIVHFDVYDDQNVAIAYAGQIANYANNCTTANSSKYTASVASSPNKPYLYIGGANRGFGMLYSNTGGGWYDGKSTVGGSNSYTNGYYSYQIGFNYMYPNGSTNALRTAATSLGKNYLVSSTIYNINTTTSSLGIDDDDYTNLSSVNFGYTLYNKLKGKGVYTAGLLQHSLVTYTGMDGLEYKVPNYKSDTVHYIATMLRDALVIPDVNAYGFLYNHIVGSESALYCEDMDGDGKLDTVDEDVDGDGHLDINEDKNGNGILDLGEDLDYDGNLDVNEDLNGNGILDVSEDLDGDGHLDVDEDVDGDGLIDPGEDVDGDGHLDVDEDANGNGRLDLSEDVDGDGRLDTVNEDVNGNGILDSSEDVDGDGKLDTVDEDLDGDGNLDVNEDLNGNGILDKSDLATALRQCLGVTYASGHETATTQSGTMGGNVGTLGSYSQTLAKTNVNGVNQLIGPFLKCAPYIKTHFDAAYYLLHNLFVGDSYNQSQDDYNYLVLTKATVESLTTDGEDKEAYVFDAGFTYEDGTSGVVYDREKGTISLSTAEAKKQIVYIGESSTNLHPFLPIYDGDDDPDEEFTYTYSHYAMEEGVMNSADIAGDSYVGRNYNYTLQANGEFVFHYDDDLFFNFEGDDDVYLFINDELVLDIGGAHSITKVGFNTNDYVDKARSTLSKLTGYTAGMDDDAFERVLSNNGITGSTAEEYRRLHKLNLVDGQSYTIDFYYMERHGWGANMRIATNIVMTDPTLQTEKQAYQGTDANGDLIEVEYGSVVDDSQPVDYSFTVTNEGNTKLYRMSFMDADIGVNLSYDKGLQIYGKPTDTQFITTADTVLRITGLDGAITLDDSVYYVYQNGKITWEDSSGATKTANGISIPYDSANPAKNIHSLVLYQLDSQELFKDVTAYVDLGGSVTVTPTANANGVYNLTVGKTNHVTVAGIRTTDANGGLLDVSDLTITISGYESYEDYRNGVTMTPISIKLSNNAQLKAFLTDLADPQNQTSTGEGVPEGKSSLYWGAGLWQHSSLTISGFWYTLTEAEAAAKVFDNTVYTYGYKSMDAPAPLWGQAQHRVYCPGEPTYYQWSEHEVYLGINKLWADVLEASTDPNNALYEQAEGIQILNQYGVDSLSLMVCNRDGNTLTSCDNLYSGGIWSTYKEGQVEESNDYRTLYFRQIYDWEKLYIYYWTDSNVEMVQWPGKEMTAVAGENGIYSCQVPSEARYVIFNNGSGEQTKNISVPFVDYNKVTWDDLDRLLQVDYNEVGMHTFYVQVSSTGTTETVLVPITFYVTDVKDSYYVLDYGLTVSGMNTNGQLFRGDDLLGFHAMTDARVMGVSVTQPSYFYDYSSEAADLKNINRISFESAATYRANPSSSEDLSVYVDAGDGKYYLGSAIAANGSEIYFDGTNYAMDKRIWFTPEDFMDETYSLWLAISIHEANKGFTTTTADGYYHTPGVDNTAGSISSAVDIGVETQMYKKITVLPATVVYYEDDFDAINYTGFVSDGDDKTAGKFVHHGIGTGELTQSADQDVPYGQDDTYRTTLNSEMSGGSMTTVNISDTSDVASFTFTGTGFELISRTNAFDSASIVVEVFAATAAGAKVSDTPVKRIPVITELTSSTAVCKHTYHNTNGYCSLCGSSVSHSYVDGVCTVCNAPEVDYYLFGYINGTDVGTDSTAYKFVDGRLTATFSTDSYLVVRDTHGKQYWTNGYPGDEVTSAVLYDSTASTSVNIQADKLRVPAGLEVTLTLVDNGNGSMTLGYSSQVEQYGERTLYFDNSATGWDEVYIYFWTNGVTAQYPWPGTLMNKLEDSDLYFYVVPTDAKLVIFSNGSGGTGNQTGDLEIPGDGYIYRDGGWTLDETDSGTKNVYFLNTFGGVTPYAYYWSDSNSSMVNWPGVPMTEVQENVYAIELPAEATKLIFNDGSNQTGDLIIPGDAYLYNGVEWSKYTGEVPTSKIVYFENTDGWATPYAYYWASGNNPVSWPGLEMNKIGSTNVYWIEIPIAMTGIVFSDNGDNQTLDLTLDSDTPMYSNGSWTVYKEPNSDARIYFENTEKWSGVYVYYWSDTNGNMVSWPGVQMTNSGNSIYSATIPADAKYVIFNDGLGGSNQTLDLTFSSNKELYSDGQWYSFTDESGKQINQVPVIRVDDLSYGKYIVEISGMPLYADNTDWTSSDLSQYVEPTYLYIDGVRIYQPLGASNAAYSAAENSAAFYELRDLIMGGKAAVATFDVSTTVYSGNMSWSENRNGYLYDAVSGEIKTYVGNQLNSIYDYLVVGPNNEVYVNGNLKKEAIIFYVTEEAGTTQHTLQVAARGLDQGMYQDGEATGVSANLYQSMRYQYPDGSTGYGWKPVADIVSGTEQYYTIDYSACPYTVIDGVRTYQVALYVRNGTVSFSSIKTVGLTVCQAIGEESLLFYKDGMLSSPAYSLLCDSEGSTSSYSFNNGKLTLTFDSDTYVAVQWDSGEGSRTYLTDGDMSDALSATMYESSTLGNNGGMLLIPAGVEATFTLGVISADAVSLSYTVDPSTCAHMNRNEQGRCVACGELSYYLFGYINGADYGCENDAENLGEYKFENGTLTVTFSEDSYVAVKTSDNAVWYMTNGWVGDTATSANLYDVNTEIDANKLRVPGGSEVTFTLQENSDGSLTLSYVVNCEHDYSVLMVSPTCTDDGAMIYSCIYCGTGYTETIPATGHSYKSKVTAPTCELGGYTTYTCGTCGYSYTGNQVAANGHSFYMGMCSVCGVEKEGYLGYYLFGFINGMEYAYESDYENLGEYKFAGGKLTVKFNTDSYVGVKSGSNAQWYKAASYTEASSAVLYLDGNGGNDLMKIPGGVEVTLTLVENFDGTLTLSYVVGGTGLFSMINMLSIERQMGSNVIVEDTEAEDSVTDDQVDVELLDHVNNVPTGKPVQTVAQPTLKLEYASLSFESEIRYNIYFSASDMENVTDMGMLFFDSEKTDGTWADADQIITEYKSNGTYYMVQTDGVAAKKMGDTIYFKVYAELTDGSYVYSELKSYSAVAYANTILAKSKSEEMKALVVSMLNYGAEAQKYFGYNTDKLMNAGLSEEDQARVQAYSDDTMAAPEAVVDSKNNTFENVGFGMSYITASFDAAFSLNYYFAPSNCPDDEVIMYYWTAEDYAAAETLSPRNATGIVVMTPTGEGNQYWGNIEGIAAKEMGQTLFVGGFYTADGETYTTCVMNYSMGKYCDTIANKLGSGQQLLAKATAVYGASAEDYFAVR